MSRETSPGIPFTLLINDESRDFPPRAEPKLLNLFPVSAESQNTPNLFPLNEESQNTLSLFHLNDQPLNTLNLFPCPEESSNALGVPRDYEQEERISGQAGTSLITVQPPFDPVALPVGTQVVLVPEESLATPGKGQDNKQLERMQRLMNSIYSPQGVGNDEAMGGLPSWSLDLPFAMEARSHHGVPESTTNLGTDAVSKQDETIPRPPANLGPAKRSSPFTGVTYYKRTGRWEAHIWYRKQIYLGASSTEIQAARAYDRALIHFRGVGATGLNFNINDYVGELQQLKEISSDDLIAALRKQSSGAGMPLPIYPPAMPRN